MIEARQVPTDLQESPIDLTYAEMFDLAIDGNRNFHPYCCEEYQQTKDFISHCLSYTWNKGIDTDQQLLDILDNYLNSHGEITIDTGKKIWEKLLAYDHSKLTWATAILNILSIWTGDEWNVYTMRGTVQSEWQNVFYNTKTYTMEQIKLLEMDYFNLGTEWEIKDGDDTWSIYCYKHGDEELKEEIADAISRDVSEIKFFKFNGYVRTPDFKEF